LNTDIVLVGSGFMGRGYFKAARRLGLRVALVDVPERLEAVEGEFGDRLSGCEAVDPRSAALDEAWVGPALKLARRAHPRGVLAFSEINVLAGAYAAQDLGLPGTGVYAAHVSRNKALQRQVYGAAGVPQPASMLALDFAGLESRSFPCVIKPLSGAGSNGVEQVPDAPALREALERRGKTGPVLVEDYVSGQEYSWEALVHGGEVLFTNLTVKTTTGPPNFVEVLHIPLVDAEAERLRKPADRLGEDVVRALRISDGLVHLEFRIAEDSSLAVMEAAVRTPGDFLMDVVSRAHGFDLYAACLELAMGIRPDTRPARSAARHTASLFLVAGRPGTVVPPHADELAAVPGVFRSGLRQTPGSVVAPPRSSGDRVAFALIDCATRADLNRAIGQAGSALSLEPALQFGPSAPIDSATNPHSSTEVYS
jgi:biotin carboxylase